MANLPISFFRVLSSSYSSIYFYLHTKFRTRIFLAASTMWARVRWQMELNETKGKVECNTINTEAREKRSILNIWGKYIYMCVCVVCVRGGERNHLPMMYIFLKNFANNSFTFHRFLFVCERTVIVNCYSVFLQFICAKLTPVAAQPSRIFYD
jgi:hypothetical protein